jgi:hypothetical protein
LSARLKKKIVDKILFIFFFFLDILAVEDAIKVVVDKKNDQVAETGFFEQIFKQVIMKI